MVAHFEENVTIDIVQWSLLETHHQHSQCMLVWSIVSNPDIWPGSVSPLFSLHKHSVSWTVATCAKKCCEKTKKVCLFSSHLHEHFKNRSTGCL
jgi:hypothetical protein